MNKILSEDLEEKRVFYLAFDVPDSSKLYGPGWETAADWIRYNNQSIDDVVPREAAKRVSLSDLKDKKTWAAYCRFTDDRVFMIHGNYETEIHARPTMTHYLGKSDKWFEDNE